MAYSIIYDYLQAHPATRWVIVIFVFLIALFGITEVLRARTRAVIEKTPHPHPEHFWQQCYAKDREKRERLGYLRGTLFQQYHSMSFNEFHEILYQEDLMDEATKTLWDFHGGDKLNLIDGELLRDTSRHFKDHPAYTQWYWSQNAR